MIGLGIDIGTTTICGAVVEGESGRVLESLTRPNDSALTAAESWESLQDAERIISLCLEIKSYFADRYPQLEAIGISGQMHGMLYVDAKGRALSPLCSWQDGRGDLSCAEGETYCERMSRLSGYHLATGYGLTTHYYNSINNRIPEGAVTFCTIGDYLGMQLTERQVPLLHKSMAASLGVFDVAAGNFDRRAVAALGIDPGFLPQVSDTEEPLGTDRDGRVISMALGDNQASFLGAVPADSNMLINIGTGSQISICTDTYRSGASVEFRPYLNDTYLMVGSPLCGGASYAYLKRFFEATMELFGQEQAAGMYQIMNDAAARAYDNQPVLSIETKFKGSRLNPKERGSISNIDFKNFTPENLIIGMIRGICGELYEIYGNVKEQFQISEVITASGNGVRENKVMQRVIEDMFGRKVRLPNIKEEAACGGALYGLYAGGCYKSPEEIRLIIQGREKK